MACLPGILGTPSVLAMPDILTMPDILAMPGALAMPGVLGVPSISGVLAMPGVLGVFDVPGVSGEGVLKWAEDEVHEGIGADLALGTAEMVIPASVVFINAALTVFWIFRVHDGWVRESAEAYADRLIHAYLGQQCKEPSAAA